MVRAFPRPNIYTLPPLLYSSSIMGKIRLVLVSGEPIGSFKIKQSWIGARVLVEAGRVLRAELRDRHAKIQSMVVTLPQGVSPPVFKYDLLVAKMDLEECCSVTVLLNDIDQDDTFHCTICGMMINGPEQYMDHVRGKKHIKRCKAAYAY